MVTRACFHALRTAALPVACGILLSSAVPASAQQGSVLLWPVNPVIEADARAAALWLENPGKIPVTLQIRIFAWAQQEGKNVYAPQNEVIGTPPLVTIAPGAKQLVRLTRTGAPTDATETPYRIVIDEIPTGAEPAGTGASIAFRMRYSLPLFAHGGPRDASGRDKRALPPAIAPQLAWRVVREAGAPLLEIRNNGKIHARLVDVSFANGTAKGSLAPGLLGYVLAGSVARWPLPPDLTPSGPLVAAINGSEAQPIPPAAE